MNVTGELIYPPGFIDRLDALLETRDRDAAISTMFRDLVGMPQEEVEYLRSLPAWQERVKAAHTVPRELRADEVYRFDDERFGELRVPTLMPRAATALPSSRRPTRLWMKRCRTAASL